MKYMLQPGLTFEFKYRVPENRTVPYLYPESPEFQSMPTTATWLGCWSGPACCPSFPISIGRTSRPLAPWSTSLIPPQRHRE